MLAKAVSKGNAELELPAGMAKAPLSIAVNCQGKGILEVTVKPINLSFPLKCVESEVSSTFNQIALKRPRAEGAVYIEAPSSVRWAVAVGQ